MQNATLRVFVGCQKPNIWFEEDHTGVAWHGEPAWRLNDVKSVTGLEYEVVTGHKEEKAIKTGLADMGMVSHGLNQMKANNFDFSYPVSFREVYIFSGKGDGRVQGNVFKDVFDDTSYSLAAISLAIMVLLTFIILKKETSHPSIILTMLHMFGNVFKQALPSSMTPRSYIGAAWLIFVPTYNMLMCMMYSSIIISMLTVVIETNMVNNMGDLNTTENENVRIFLNERSFVPGLLKDANMLTGFENRIDYFLSKNRTIKKLDEEFVLKSILNGSHVLIDTFWRLRNLICLANKKAGREVVTAHDFWKSTDPVLKTRRGVLVRKKYPHAENIDKGLIWFHALGFWEIWDVTVWYNLDLRRNDGIRAPDGGLCKNRAKKQACTLIPKMDFSVRKDNLKAININIVRKFKDI